MRLFSNTVSVEALETRTHFAAYHLTYTDEFTAFNQSRYSTSDFWGMRNNSGDFQAQWFSDTANNGYNPFSTSTAGQVGITADRTPPGVNAQGLPYVSGQLTTAHKYTQRYGYYELKAKTPAGKGLWSRFWLLADDGNWPSGGEYDVFEILGKETNKVRQTTHYADANGNHAAEGNPVVTSIDPTDGMHTYGLLWEPTGVTWYVDGVATGTQVNRVNTPMYALIDLAVGNDPGNLWPGNPDASTQFPAKMQVDYFRIYSADPSLPSVTPEAGITYPTTLPGNNTVVQTSTTPQLPSGWTSGDLGTPDVKGSATWNSTTGEWMLKGAGWGIGGWGDQGYFAGKSMIGDGAVSATVQTVTKINTDDVKAGVMIRDTTAANSRAISLLHTTTFKSPGSNLPPVLTTNITLQVRNANGGNTTTLANVSGVNSPVTLRIARSGNVFTAGYSTNNGASWTTVGTPQTLAMPGTTQAGLAIGENGDNYLRLARATFNNVSVGPTIIPTLTVSGGSTSVATGQSTQFTANVVDQFGSPVDTTGSPVVWSVVGGGGTIAADGTYTAPSNVGTGTSGVRATWGTASDTKSLSVTLPAPFTSTNVGVTPAGESGSVGGTWTVAGGGAGIAINSSVPDNVDAFRFVSRTLAGNGSITVKLTSSTGPQSGIVFRDDTGTGDRYAGLWRTASGVRWATRETVNGGAVLRAPTGTLPAGAPVWLRLTRSGTASDTFTGSYSTDGVTWTSFGARTFTMNSTARVGLAVSSGSSTTTSTGTFTDLTVSQSAPQFRAASSTTQPTSSTLTSKTAPVSTTQTLVSSVTDVGEVPFSLGHPIKPGVEARKEWILAKSAFGGAWNHAHAHANTPAMKQLFKHRFSTIPLAGLSDLFGDSLT